VRLRTLPAIFGMAGVYEVLDGIPPPVPGLGSDIAAEPAHVQLSAETTTGVQLVTEQFVWGSRRNQESLSLRNPSRCLRGRTTGAPSSIWKVTAE
jgi:hypothetical protein